MESILGMVKTLVMNTKKKLISIMIQNIVRNKKLKATFSLCIIVTIFFF
jgi:hypothetical protein